MKNEWTEIDDVFVLVLGSKDLQSMLLHGSKLHLDKKHQADFLDYCEGVDAVTNGDLVKAEKRLNAACRSTHENIAYHARYLLESFKIMPAILRLNRNGDR
jgi:hypothetical protein